jgi:hypothetical protein
MASGDEIVGQSELALHYASGMRDQYSSVWWTYGTRHAGMSAVEIKIFENTVREKIEGPQLRRGDRSGGSRVGLNPDGDPEVIPDAVGEPLTAPVVSFAGGSPVVGAAAKADVARGRRGRAAVRTNMLRRRSSCCGPGAASFHTPPATATPS